MGGDVTTEVALRAFKAGRLFEPGDRFDRASVGEMTDRVHALLVRQKMLGPLTRENYAFGIAQRPPGTVGRGFTLAFLVGAGIIDQPPEHPPKATPAPGRNDDVIFEGYVLRPRPVGRPGASGQPLQRWSVLNRAGELVRQQEFKGRRPAEAFVRSLVDSAKKGGETAHDLQLQS